MFHVNFNEGLSSGTDKWKKRAADWDQRNQPVEMATGEH